MENLQEVPCMRFVEKYLNNHEDCAVPFHITSLKTAIQEACYVEDFSSRRVLMLYIHNDNEVFSQQLCSHLKQEDVVNIINDYFYVLAWDITTESEQDILKDEVKEIFDLEIMVDFITKKKSAVFFVTTVSSVLNVFSFMHGEVTKENLILTLQQIQIAMIKQYELEKQLQIINQKESENSIGSSEFQQIMYDRLGDRDYDCFEFSEHEHLRSKIGFALYGPPKQEEGYQEKEKKEITRLYDKICLVNSK